MLLQNKRGTGHEARTCTEQAKVLPYSGAAVPDVHHTDRGGGQRREVGKPGNWKDFPDQHVTRDDLITGADLVHRARARRIIFELPARAIASAH